MRMKTKENLKLNFVYCPFSGREVEVPVCVIRDHQKEEYIVSDTPQTLLGRMPKRFERVYTGPYSMWQN